MTFGAVRGGADCNLALSNAIVAASAVTGGGSVLIPDGTFNLSSLDITASNVRFTGNGKLLCSGIVTNWLKITGTNIQISGPKFDGANLAQAVLTAGAYSTDWLIEKAR